MRLGQIVCGGTSSLGRAAVPELSSFTTLFGVCFRRDTGKVHRQNSAAYEKNYTAMAEHVSFQLENEQNM